MPYWRLSSFYFFYFGSLGALVPYWSLYLDHLGFSAVQIGEMMALLMATRIISPNIWGWIADHTGHRLFIVRLGTFLAALCFCGVFLGSSYWWLVLVMAAFSFFWNAALPQFEAMTMNHLGSNSHRYSHVRVWGSIGFILSAAGLGPLFQNISIAVLPAVLVTLFAGIWLATQWAPPEKPWQHHEHHGPLKHVLRRRAVLAFLVVCFLNQASHGPYYTFYSLYLTDHHYSRTLIGLLWSLGVVAEVVVYLVLHRVMKQESLRLLLLLSLGLASGRWLMIAAFPGSILLLGVAQLAHAATFGIFHAVAIQYVHRFFVGRNQGRGQAIYSSLGFGLGGAVGSFYSGYTWDNIGQSETYVIAALLSLASFFIAWWGVRDKVASPEVQSVTGR